MAALFFVASFTFSYSLKHGKSIFCAASELNQATLILQSKMEEIKQLPFSQVASLEGESFAESRGEISITPILDDLLEIELELSWATNKEPICLFTLRSNYE